jgi:hypothetical protein
MSESDWIVRQAAVAVLPLRSPPRPEPVDVEPRRRLAGVYVDAGFDADHGEGGSSDGLG